MVLLPKFGNIYVFMCVKLQSGSNMDTKKKSFCILSLGAFNGYNLKYQGTDYMWARTHMT